MGTAESLPYYDEGGGEGVEGDGADGAGQQVNNSPAPSSHAAAHHVPPSTSPASGGSARQQQNDDGGGEGGGDGNARQSPPLTLRGFVVGSSGSGKTCLVRRLRGENPFAGQEDALAAAAAAAAAEPQRRQRRQRKRKMMALVPWRDRRSGQHCQLHVVEKTVTNDVVHDVDDDNDDAAAAATARDVALEALGDRPDFCICMIDPRSESSVEFAKAAIDTLLNASVDDDRATLSRPNICALINYMDSIKVVDDEELGEAGDNDGLCRMTQSRLLDICADIISMQSTGDADKNGAMTTIPPSIQIYPSSMVSCSGLSSLHSFIMLPYMRKNEVRMLRDLDTLRRNHNKSMANLRDGGVKAMQEAIDESKARMSTAPPINSGRRSIIQRKGVQGISNGSGPRQSAATASEWEKRRVRIDESRNTNHFEGDEALPTESAAASVRQENIDEMTKRLQGADQARRRRRQRALDGVKKGEGGPKKTYGEEESSGRGRRSIISSKQRHAMSETISKLPTTSSKGKQPRKQTKSVTDDPMQALEAFLGSDSDSDSGGNPVRSGVEGAAEDSDSDNDSSSGGNDGATSTDDDEGPRHSILLSDSDSEDDDYYYDQEGHANYSHLDDRKKPAAKKQVDENPPSERVESVAEEVSADSNVDTPEKRDSKTPRSDHDEEEKKDESPSGRPTGDDQSKPSPSLSNSDGEKAVDTEEGGGESTERREILDSEDESVDNYRPEILHSDDESTPPVEILHSGDDDDDGLPSPAPLPERSPAVNDSADENDDVSDSEPPVASSSSNILVDALEAEATADEPKTVSEDPTSPGMSAAVAAALAAAEEDARRMVLEAVSPEKTKKKRSKAKKKKKSDRRGARSS